MRRSLPLVLFVSLVMVFAGGTATAFQEAPMLADLVEAGELPPVEDRLPADPLVVDVVEEIGAYGGSLRVMSTNPNNFEDGVNVMGREPLLQFNPEDGQTVEPNLVESWDFSEDGTQLTLKLREGIKWSDGHPFTADDLMFWYEDVLLNDELTPVKPAWTRVEGEIMDMTKLGDYEVQLDFAGPYSSILIRLAAWATSNNFFLPKHYLSQYHPDYVPADELEAMVAEEGYDEWYELFGARQALGYFDGIQNPDAPTVRAFKSVRSTADGWVGERNPYYWKVDSEGNQLPYVDEIRVDLVADAEMYTMMALAGEVDLAQWNTSLDNFTLYMEYAEDAGMRVLRHDTAWPSMARYLFNMNHQDPVMRDIFHDVDFRIALSLGIDRDEINEMVFFGMGVPMQNVILPPDGRFWDEERSKRYTEYDPERANELLDQVGLDEWGADGYRLRPDGEPMSIEILYWPGEGGPQKRSITELVQHYWEQLGIEVDVQEAERTYQQVRREAADFDMTLWHTGQMSDPLFILNPWHLVPTTWESGAPYWTEWYNTEGESGEVPPEYIQRLFHLWEVMQTSLSDEEVVAAGNELMDIYIDNLYSIGTVGLVEWPVLVNEDLRNVPETGLLAWDWVYLSRYRPEQFYLRQ